jgi:hypothetical protein
MSAIYGDTVDNASAAIAIITTAAASTAPHTLLLTVELQLQLRAMQRYALFLQLQVVSRMSNLDGQGSRWYEFDIALEAFNEMVEQQKEGLKTVIQDEVNII